jgi:hypothetical protein
MLKFVKEPNEEITVTYKSKLFKTERVDVYKSKTKFYVEVREDGTFTINFPDDHTTIGDM